MTRRWYGLRLPLRFPAGLAPGAGSDFNTLRIARDGQGRPVLRGTSLAGALRHAWWQLQREQGLDEDALQASIVRYFGEPLGDDESDGLPPARGDEADADIAEATDRSGDGEWRQFPDSPLRVSDCVLHLGQSSVVTRTHHRRDRHRGVVAHGGLFSIEACPPGTTATAVLWLRDTDSGSESALGFLRTVVGLFGNGLTLGGKSARGLGQALLNGPATCCVYNLADRSDYARWLNDDRQWRLTGQFPDGPPLEPQAEATAGELRVDLVLGIPRGQDLLIADGQGLLHEMEPQRVRGADGRWYWRFPGASLRGVLRGWVHRLAARDEQQGKLPAGQRVSDPAADRGEKYGPADESQWNCPVARLFGSTLCAGRLHISDALVPCDNPKDADQGSDLQQRKHVAVDRITGGAAESMLFDNTVLTADARGRSPRFRFSLQISRPEVRETQWLAGALRALDLGILRVGSSKSSGRMSLVEPLSVHGGSEDTTKPFQQLRPLYGPEMFGD